VRLKNVKPIVELFFALAAFFSTIRSAPVGETTHRRGNGVLDGSIALRPHRRADSLCPDALGVLLVASGDFSAQPVNLRRRRFELSVAVGHPFERPHMLRPRSALTAFDSERGALVGESVLPDVKRLFPEAFLENRAI
jgi:hypothetical protein